MPSSRRREAAARLVPKELTFVGPATAGGDSVGVGVDPQSLKALRPERGEVLVMARRPEFPPHRLGLDQGLAGGQRGADAGVPVPQPVVILLEGACRTERMGPAGCEDDHVGSVDRGPPGGGEDELVIDEPLDLDHHLAGGTRECEVGEDRVAPVAHGAGSVCLERV